MKTILLLVISLATLTTLSGCLNGTNSDSSDTEMDLITTADSYEQLNTFSEYADSLNLDTVLSESNSYTLFAPDNNAFSRLPKGILDTLSEEQLREVLTYHLADTTLFFQQLNRNQQITSLQGDDLFISAGTNSISINNGEIIGGNIQTTNGVLHATNTVFFPNTYLDIFRIVAKRYQLGTMESALAEAELVDKLSERTDNGFTIFAPSNCAFQGITSPENQEALKDTMEYYIVPQTWRSDELRDSQMLETMNGQELEIGVGETITVNDSASVTTADLEGTNGVVHIIDTFLAPPE